MLSHLTHFLWAHLFISTNTFHADLDVSLNWELCPSACLGKICTELLLNGDLLLLFNCHYLFEHVEFVMKSLSNSDSSQIQYSVSFQLFCFPSNEKIGNFIKHLKAWWKFPGASSVVLCYLWNNFEVPPV